MKKIIYADNAATTKLNKKAYEAMLPYLMEEYGNPSQAYSFSRGTRVAIKHARETIADCINADPHEIYFTSGGTESDNWAVKGVAFANPTKSIITSQIEHHAILKSCEFLERQKFPVAYVPVTENGVVEPETLRKHLIDTTSLVSIMLANNEIGTIQDINELASIAHERGIMFHTDAVQAVGHVAVDVKALDIDLLSASAHKFGGPKGIGFLYIKQNTKIVSYLNGGAQEYSNRAGTENVAGIVGMAVALRESVAESDKYIRLYDEEVFLIKSLQEHGFVLGSDFLWNGHHAKQKHLPGLISLSFKNHGGEAIMHRLDLKGIMISTGAACDSVNTQVSHVLKAINIPSDFAQGTIRISLNQNISHYDVIAIADALIEVLK